MQRAKTPVTAFLIAVNILGFVYEFVRLGPGILSGNVTLQGLIDVGAIFGPLVTHDGQWWRLVTGGFLHGFALHIAINMYSLYVLGRFIEAIAGSTKMAIVYAISLLGSSLAVAYFGPNEVTVGASGAIFGLFGALFAIGLKLGPSGMQLIRANVGILILNLIITFAVPGISAWGHVGGLLIGFIAAYAIYFPPRVAHATVVDANTGQELHSEIEPPQQTYR
ncbi:MAG: rhomboid family intramembrane serine protease [Candidatus Eremiobacteraeota bacterium]|nr:rhomboid family intramembrane serine protease [Candidatus Eremiobacteraeota bacterium]